MFQVFSLIKVKFNRDLDQEKLKTFRKNSKTSNAEILSNYCREIHYIMQRHFTDEKMLVDCKQTLKYIENIIKYREDIKYVKTQYNSCVTTSFATTWNF